MHLLILYEELAWYFVNCLNFLAENKQVKILVFAKQVNAVAPFKFDYIHPNISINYREDYTLPDLLKKSQSFSPTAIYLGGWSYKPYIQLVKKISLENTVIGFDNQYSGSSKQRLGALYFKLTLKRYIKFAFVPGPQQFKFAQKLGFEDKDIATGAYCCDTKLFGDYYLDNKVNKEKHFPKRFLFVGRYAIEKDIETLWTAFSELQSETPSEWELWCVGNGEIKPIEHPKIKHFGFLQPKQMAEVISKTGVFVLPSLFEPWGVVVHEYAAAGFPLICSNKVGACSIFLDETKNGYSYTAGNKNELKLNLKKMMDMDNENLNLMSHNSSEIANRITPQVWATNLTQLIWK